ncbi:TPA: hypothetical protein DCX15_04610 [bacterium]|nr:hypothetical protein [bacterium]
MERGMNKGETFIKLFLVISLVLGVGLGLKEIVLSFDEKEDLKEREMEERMIIKKLPQTIETIKKRLKEDPSQDLSDYLVFWVRMAHKDPRTIELYREIIKKSTNVDTVRCATTFLVQIGKSKRYNRKDIVLPILMETLNHPSIDIRLNVAEELFEWGYKKEVYPVYVGIVMKDPKELKNELENRPLRGGFKMAFQIAKEDPDYKEDLYVRIARWRIAPIINAIEKLIEYDDSRTRKLVRKALFENEYISSVVTKFRRDIETQRPKRKALERTWAKERERKMKFFEGLDAYLRKQ